MNCLQGLDNEYCKDNETVRIEMPEEGSLVKFHDGQYHFKVSFVMYADFEANLEPIQAANPGPEESYTKEINRHIPSGFCAKSKFAYGKVKDPLNLYRD